MDVKKIRNDFPIFKTYPNLVYLDNAATSQKPELVIKAVADFYTRYNSNIHRGIYDLSEKATKLFERTREKVAQFVGASSPDEIVFTSNASEAINFVAYGFARKFLKPKDFIVLSEMEHHSNIVPWIRLKEEMGVNLYFTPITKNYELDYQKILISGVPREKIKLVALTHVSNVLGTVNPISKIVSFLKRNGISARVLVDGAQSIPHIPIDVKELDCDFFVFSSHKILGPSGVGVLWAKREILRKMDPFFVGSHMIETVTKKRATWAEIPSKFETGTRNLEGVVGLGAAIDYLKTIGIEEVENYEKELTDYTLARLFEIKGLNLFGKWVSKGRTGVFSFTLGNIHPHDTGEILNKENVCIRTGHHCAQPLMKVLGVFATARASTYFYNTRKDIDRLFNAIMQVKKIFK